MGSEKNRFFFNIITSIRGTQLKYLRMFGFKWKNIVRVSLVTREIIVGVRKIFG